VTDEAIGTPPERPAGQSLLTVLKTTAVLEPPATIPSTPPPAPEEERPVMPLAPPRGGGMPVPRWSVRLEDVRKVYPNGKVALTDVTLAIPEGDFVFLVAASGAGKSTLIKLLVHDEIASTGSVEVTGRDLARIGRRDIPKLRRQIGVIFQDFKLLPRKTCARTSRSRSR